MGFIDFLKKLTKGPTKDKTKPVTMSIKNVLIAGAGGNLGPAILEELIAAKKYNVSVLTRPDSTSSFPSSVTVYKTDYSSASLNTVLSTAKPDAIVSALAVAIPSVAELQIALIDAAKVNGVKRFIPSEYGSDTLNPEVNSLVPIFGSKIKAVEHLKSLQSDNFTWTALITGPFFDWGIRAGFVSIDQEAKRLFKWDDGSTPFSASNLSTIGKAIASLLADSDKLSATANKYIYITSHTITNNEYIEAVQKATPNDKWTIESLNSEEVLKHAQEELKKGNHSAVYDLLKVITFGKRRLGAFDDAKLSNKLLGLEKEDLLADLKSALAPAPK